MFISKNEEIIDTLLFDTRSIGRGLRYTGGVSGDALVCVIPKLLSVVVAIFHLGNVKFGHNLLELSVK
jgi:hypothetical protein